MRTHEVFAVAHEIVHYRGGGEVMPQHVLLATLLERGGPAVRVLRHLGVPLEELARALEGELPPRSGDVSLPLAYTWTASEADMLARARQEAQALGHPHEGCEHLLLAFLRDERSAIARHLGRYGVNFANARNDLLRVLGSPEPGLV